MCKFLNIFALKLVTYNPLGAITFTLPPALDKMQYLHTLIVFSITFSLINQTLCGFKETDNTPLSRQKRFLVWKRGFNWVQVRFNTTLN